MSDEPASLITPAMEAVIGREGASYTRTIDRDAVLAIAEAYDEDPAVLAAIRVGDRALVLPAYALLSLRRDGGEFDALTIPDLPPHSMLAGDGWVVHAPLHLGDELTITHRTADIQERIGGRVGHSLFLHQEQVCRNVAGEVVARMQRVLACFPERWGD